MGGRGPAVPGAWRRTGRPRTRARPGRGARKASSQPCADRARLLGRLVTPAGRSVGRTPNAPIAPTNGIKALHRALTARLLGKGPWEGPTFRGKVLGPR